MSLQDYFTLFPGSSREKSRFIALAQAVLQQVVDLQTVAGRMQAAYSVDNAVGEQLDEIAGTLGILRSDVGENASDADFRQYVLAKLALWRWDGSNGTAQAVLEETLPGSTETDNQDGTVTVTPAGRKDLVPVSAGVRVVQE